mmetsp:Transcript_2928/g.5342  ORF Transcript_2928/g.5342 Transcript_2928/m.5342 type:complete len:234 (+) Transcript_2928:1073-1774(+)
MLLLLLSPSAHGGDESLFFGGVHRRSGPARRRAILGREGLLEEGIVHHEVVVVVEDDVLFPQIVLPGAAAAFRPPAFTARRRMRLPVSNVNGLTGLPSLELVLVLVQVGGIRRGRLQGDGISDSSPLPLILPHLGAFPICHPFFLLLHLFEQLVGLVHHLGIHVERCGISRIHHSTLRLPWPVVMLIVWLIVLIIRVEVWIGDGGEWEGRVEVIVTSCHPQCYSVLLTVGGGG